MFRIDGPGATQDNKFTEGDPASGGRATVVTDGWLNAVQEELANTIESDGFVLDKADSGQLSAVFKRRVIGVGSLAELNALPAAVEGQEALVLGAPFIYNGVNWKKSITYDEARKRLQDYNGGHKVREPLLGERYEWQQLASDTIEACERVTTDGTGTVVWQPDAGGFYNACWIRDMAMMMEWYPNYFTPAQISAAFEWYLSYSNTGTDYQVPDHIGLDGTIFTTPGSANNWGARAPIDGNTYLLQLCWLHYRLTGSPSLFSTYKQDVINLLEVGVTLNVDGVVEVPNDSAWYVCFGFQDTVRMSGVTAFGNMLVFQAYNRLAELSFAAGDDGRSYLEKAEVIKKYLNTNLFSIQPVTSPSFGITRQIGFYDAATNVCQQPDAWASCFAVTCGLAGEGERRAIGSKLAYHLEAPISFDGSQLVQYSTDLFSFGGMRHVPEPDQFGPSQMWEAYFSAPTYGEYQNGGYWSTPIAWAIDAMRGENPGLAKKMYAYLLSEYTREEYLLTATVPAEWWTVDLSVVGAVEYGTSGAVLGFADAGNLPTTYIQSELKNGGEVQSLPANTFTNLGFSEIKRDELQTADTTDSSFIAPEWGPYDIEVCATLSGAAADINVFIALFLNGVENSRMAGGTFGGSSVAILKGSIRLFLQRGDKIDVRANILGTSASVDNSAGSAGNGNYFRVTKGV